MELFALWLVMAGVCAVAARYKGLNEGLIFLGGLALWPIVLVAAIRKPKNDKACYNSSLVRQGRSVQMEFFFESLVLVALSLAGVRALIVVRKAGSTHGAHPPDSMLSPYSMLCPFCSPKSEQTLAGLAAPAVICLLALLASIFHWIFLPNS